MAKPWPARTPKYKVSTNMARPSSKILENFSEHNKYGLESIGDKKFFPTPRHLGLDWTKSYKTQLRNFKTWKTQLRISKPQLKNESPQFFFQNPKFPPTQKVKSLFPLIFLSAKTPKPFYP
jgi:hypothetical protein